MGRRARMRKLLREEDVEELQELLEQAEAAPKAEPEAETAKGAKADPTARVLELQKSAGNRAVGAALSRWPRFGAPAVEQWPKEPQMIVDGTPIPIESIQEGVRGTNVPPTTGPGSATNQKPNVTGPGEVVVTLKVGDYSPGLLERSLRGKGYKTVEIVLPGKDGKGIRFILTDVMIANYSMGSGSGSPVESLELSFKKREFSQDPPPPNGRR